MLHGQLNDPEAAGRIRSPDCAARVEETLG